MLKSDFGLTQNWQEYCLRNNGESAVYKGKGGCRRL